MGRFSGLSAKSAATKSTGAVSTVAVIVCALLGACGGQEEAPALPTAETTMLPSASPSAPEAPIAPPVPEASTAPRTVRLGAGFTPDPWVVAGEAETTVDAAGLDSACTGFIPSMPSVLFQADTAITELSVMAQGSEPGVALVVQGPEGGFRCAHADAEEQIVIDGFFAAGQHKIWFGTHTESARARYRLGFSELPDLSAAGVAGAALAP